jgi:glycosyltransferase involved in cell wall biosynthesis
VPAQIFAQSSIDNVFWLNLNHQVRKEWLEKKNVFHNLDDCHPTLDSIPSPFNAPDIVVIEGFYDFFLLSIVKEIQQRKIPYLIIPRGEMNDGAQKSKWLKKKIANFLWFNRMVARSAAIVYLSENERDNSTSWKEKKNFIIPNGINNVKCEKQFELEKGINAIFIGRMDIYHKGIDSLLTAIASVAQQLRAAGFILSLYGPEWNNSYSRIAKLIKENQINDIVLLRNAIYDREKIDILKKSDLFVLTSRFEGLPMGLLEAMSFGLPCLVTPGTNMLETIQKHDAGWYSECNWMAISQTLLSIIKEKEKFDEKSRNASSLASMYSWNSIAQLSHDIYENILGEKK